MSLSKSLLDYAGAMGMEYPGLVTGILASSLTVVYLVKSKLSSPRLPPGPPAWPIVGSLLSVSKKMYLDIPRLRQQYGDVFTVWIGRQPLIALASYSAIKEAFLTRGNDFADRCDHASLMLSKEIFLDEIANAAFSDKWSRNKKYTLSCLRTLGGIKAGADGSIVDEMAVVISKLRELNQNPVDIDELTLNATTNIISGVLFNERMDHDDPKLHQLRDLCSDFYAILNEFSFIDFFMPHVLQNLLGGNKAKRFIAAIAKLRDYFAERVAEHRKTFDADHMRDFVDMYIKKQDLEIGNGFYDTMTMFTLDAVHSMAVFMRWIVLYVGLHPEIQKKIQAEIDEAVGPSQMITIAERPKLKYTEAVMLEVFRISDCAVSSGFHSAIADGATFRGYDIPRYCTMTASFYGVHKDPELFPEPEQFDPQRFLDGNGDLVKSHLVIPFGIGRRMCLGEGLSRLELLLFLANVLHVFSIEFPADQLKPSVEPLGGLSQAPHSYKAIFVPRE